jgi:hypothetical protein
LIECNDDSIENDLIELADGSLAMAISEKDAISPKISEFTLGAKKNNSHLLKS